MNCVLRSGLWPPTQSRVVDLFCSNRSQIPVAHVFRFGIRDNVSRFYELLEQDHRLHALLLRQDRVDNRFVTDCLFRVSLVLCALRDTLWEDHNNIPSHFQGLLSTLFVGILRAQGPSAFDHDLRESSAQYLFTVQQQNICPSPKLLSFALLSFHHLAGNLRQATTDCD